MRMHAGMPIEAAMEGGVQRCRTLQVLGALQHLLELKDQYGVVKAQVATALPLLAVNLLIIYFAAFR